MKKNMIAKNIFAYMSAKNMKDKNIILVILIIRDKPYSCADCGAQFTSSGNLKTHAKLHENSKVGLQSKSRYLHILNVNYFP